MRTHLFKFAPLIAGALFLLALSATLAAAAPLPGGTLDPTLIPKYGTPLVIPPVMPYTAGAATDVYEIAVRQFQQQILPTADTLANPLGPTTVWSYGSVNPAGTFNYPAFTIEATYNRPIQVKWINDLKDQAGNCLPHLLPVDQTVHWANPPGPRDTRGVSQLPYTGPVPIVTHVHGAETNQESDGFPEAWYLPNCSVPAGINYTEGSLFNVFKTSSAVGNLWTTGAPVFTYPNVQRATTLWYHDHALGMTRLNVYAGPAGFYLLRGGPDDAVTGTLPGPAPALNDPPGTAYYEIPIVIQDRSFNSDSSLFYPDNRAFFEGVAIADLQIPFIPNTAISGQPSDISPIWNPEFFGNTMVVNGKTWPALSVEQRRYRFRFLNGSQSRFLILTTDTTNTPGNTMTPALTFWQIGAEGGFLPAPQSQTSLLIGPAERADVIVDFSGFAPGTNITLFNVAPDEPFGGGIPFYGCLTDPLAPAGCFEPSDVTTTGQVMQFQVVAISGTDNSTPPNQLVLPARTPLPAPSNTRYVSLNEQMSLTVCVAGDPVTGAYNIPIVEVDCLAANAVVFGPAEARLGTLDPVSGIPTHLEWMAGITETPLTGSTETWEIWNFTADAHPIHIHQVQFEVLSRAVLGNPAATSIAGSNAPLPSETGTKDTVIVYPGELARVKATFPSPGLTVWHCHILEHEDNEMMRPYCITNGDGSLPTSCLVANRRMLPPEKIGIVRGQNWYLDLNGNYLWDGTLVDSYFRFGLASDQPIPGNWNADDFSEVAIYRNGRFYLDTSGDNIWNAGDLTNIFGQAGNTAVRGDWNGDGMSEEGVFMNGLWYLDTNANKALDAADATFTFGMAGDRPVTGDWNGDAITDVGVFRAGVWYLDTNNNHILEPGVDAAVQFGKSGDIPAVGDWNSDIITDLGVYRGGRWYLDADGSRSWNALTDSTFMFGKIGDRPVVGRW